MQNPKVIAFSVLVFIGYSSMSLGAPAPAGATSPRKTKKEATQPQEEGDKKPGDEEASTDAQPKPRPADSGDKLPNSRAGEAPSPARDGAKKPEKAPGQETKETKAGDNAKESQDEAQDEEEEDEDDDILAKSDEDLLAELEKDVDEEPKKKTSKPGGGSGGRAQRVIQSLNPRISAIGTFIMGYTYDAALKKNGHMMARDLELKNGIHLQEVELAFQAAVDPYFRLDAFLAFGESEVGVEEAYFTSLSLPWQLQVRAGIMNLRFGRQNQQHLHMFNFVDNMLPVLRFLGNNMRAMAGELSWLTPLPWYATLSVSLSNPDSENTASFVGDGDRSKSFDVKDPRDLLYNARLDQFFPIGDNWGLNVGLSYAVGPNGTSKNADLYTHIVGGDVYLKWRPLRQPYLGMKLTAEGFFRRLEGPGDELHDWGAYAEMLWRVDQRWWLGFRYDTVAIEDSKELIRLGFEELPDAKYPMPIDDQHRGSVAVTYRPTEYSQIRIQYNYNHVRQTADDGLPEDWKSVHEVFLQLMGNIGPHGAHPY